ncbi:MAG: type II toxin-antitoxin system YoeB family toxin [Pseudanabaenaceae cyanobacterium]
MKNLEFDSDAFEDLAWWIDNDRKKALKIIKLIREIQRNPFEGTGQPEVLRHDLCSELVKYHRQQDKSKMVKVKKQNRVFPFYLLLLPWI